MEHHIGNQAINRLKLIVLVLVSLGTSTGHSQYVVEDIVLINVGNYDRGRIAKELSVVNALNPKVVAIDVAFPEYVGDSDDVSLFNALESCKGLVMASEISYLGEDVNGEKVIMINLTCAGEFFPIHAMSGFMSAERNPDDLQIPDQFSVWQKGSFSEDTYYHFSVTTAMRYDSLRAARFVNSHPQNVKVDYANGTRKFKIFSVKETLSGKLKRTDIEGKIVLFGFLGPGDTDKFLTPLNRNSGKPDMYGVEYLANIVAQILESN